MRIEEAIKQPKFKSEHEKAIINLVYTGSFLILKQSQVFKSYGVTRQQYNVLRILRGRKGEPATVKLLNERMLDKSSNVSRLVDKLVQKDLATREFCETDRRQVDIFITKKGLALLDQVAAEHPEQSEVLKDIPEEDLRRLNETLNAVRAAYGQTPEEDQ